jgi:hypothetical protein
MEATLYSDSLDDAYREIVGWRKNCFQLPQCNIAKQFVSELSRLFSAFAHQTSQESVALKATVVMPSLLLQKPFKSSKPKDHIACLERRLPLWHEGNLDALVHEGRSIQDCLPSGRSMSNQNLSRTFMKLMSLGKTHEALQGDLQAHLV